MGLIASQLSGFVGDSNPLASGHVRFVQSGADTLFEIDRDSSAGGAPFVTVLRLLNVNAGLLGAANLSLTPVSAPPSAPIAGADSGFAVGEDGSLTIDASTLLANDRSLSLTSSALTFQGLAQTRSASGATLSVDAEQITYTPGASLQWLRAGETRIDSFKYRIVDDVGLEGTGDV